MLTDAAVLACAVEVARAADLTLVDGWIVDRHGDPWTFDELALAVHARLAATSLQGAAPSVPPSHRALQRLHALRAEVGRKLLAQAEVVYEEALRRAGVKASTRARSRGTSRAVQARVEEAVSTRGPLTPLLAALGLKESELLAGAMASYETTSRATLEAMLRRQRQILADAGLDPSDYLPDESGQRDHVAAAVGALSAGLLALVRSRLITGLDHRVTAPPLPGEVTGAVPAKVVLDALRVVDGRARPVHGRTADEAPTLAPVTGTRSVEESLAASIASDEGSAITYTWIHGFYGDPLKPFEPHEDLGASNFTTTQPLDDPDLANGDSFPDGDLYQPGDHDGCTCEWEVSSAVTDDSVQLQLLPADL